jgi:hypothetical protein
LHFTGDDRISSAPVSSADDNARAEARIEALPEARDRAFDTLAGGVLRAYSRITVLESACRELNSRVKALEARPTRSVDPIERAINPDPMQSANRRGLTNDGRPDTRGGSTVLARVAMGVHPTPRLPIPPHHKAPRNNGSDKG